MDSTGTTAQNTLRIIPLGGLGEIGLNMMVMEYADSIIVIDCGLMFPEDYMLGIDIVIPDITYLRKNKEKVKAFIITHGHEDHTGALPFVLRELKAPVYGTPLTIGLIKEKLEEFKLDRENLDYARFSEYGENGVLLLLSDSTNVEKEGYTVSEKEVGVTFEEIFRKSSGRIIVAAFSSNIHRIQQVLDVADNFGRKVTLNGRSMVANVRIAQELGYLKVQDGLIVDLKELDNLPPQRAVLLTTGSQGEPMSALTRMAMDDHKQIRVRRGDTVILSSKFIPGHEKAISNMMNHLYRRGAEVIYEKVSEIHVSGHASQEELKLMLNMVKPRHFIPVHGEYRHLVKHSQLAEKVGVKKENIVLAEDGDVVEVTEGSISVRERVESGKVFVDGKGVGDVRDMVLKDRKHLSQDGLVIAILALNEKTGEIIYGPDIITRGVVFEEESAELLENARNIVIGVLDNINVEAKTDWLEVKEELRRALRRYFNKTLERRPVILPLIVEI